MIEKKLLEYKDENVLRITFDGFFDYKEFEEVRRTLREEIGVRRDFFSYGWESATGKTVFEGITLEWKFNNWDCIQLNYHNPSNPESVEKVRSWAKIIFENLIKKFGAEPS